MAVIRTTRRTSIRLSLERSNQQILSSERRDLQNEFKNRSKNRLGKKIKIVVVFTVKTIAVLKGTLACTVIQLNVLFGKS